MPVSRPKKKPPATPLGERLQHVLEERDLSARELSLKVGASPAYIAMVIRGEIGEGIGYSRYAAIAEAARVDIRWLQTGEGSMDAVTSEPVHDEALSELDRAILPFRGQLTPELEAHIRRRHVEAKAFLGGGSMGRLVTFVEDEIAAWKRQHDGMPPKVKEAPATVVTPREGAMKLERKPKGRK